MNYRRSFPNPADDESSVHSLEERIKIRVACGVLSHNGVLDSDTHTVINKSRNHIESGFRVRAEICFFLEINDQLRVCRFGELTVTALQPSRISRIVAWKHHHAWKFISSQRLRLVHRASKGGSDARNRPQIVIEVVQPLEQMLILDQCHMVKKSIAAVDKPRDASFDYVSND